MNYLIRYQPYLVGLGLGYLLHRLRETPRLPINPIALTWIWVLAALTGCLVVYGLVPYQKDPTLLASTTERALYGGLHRLAWALALAWVILACVKVRCFAIWELHFESVSIQVGSLFAGSRGTREQYSILECLGSSG